jgi:hypothetical protein
MFESPEQPDTDRCRVGGTTHSALTGERVYMMAMCWHTKIPGSKRVKKKIAEGIVRRCVWYDLSAETAYCEGVRYHFLATASLKVYSCSGVTFGSPTNGTSTK